MTRIALIIIALISLSGCATTGSYKDYLAAQSEANRQSAEAQKPLVELTAQPGQAITGLAGLKVYMPVPAPTVQQERPNEWAAVVGHGLGALTTIGGIVAGGKAAAGLAREVGATGTAGYGFVQAPTTTTTIGPNSGANSGNAGALAGQGVTLPPAEPATR